MITLPPSNNLSLWRQPFAEVTTLPKYSGRLRGGESFDAFAIRTKVWGKGVSSFEKE